MIGKGFFSNPKKMKDTGFILLFLAVPVANFLVFWLYVNFDSILLAFQIPQSNGTIEWGLDNFRRFFSEFSGENPVMLTALKNTMIFFFSNLFVVLPVSLLLCYFLYKKVAGYKAFRFIFYLPSIASFIGERVENGEYDEAAAIALARKIAYENIKAALL